MVPAPLTIKKKDKVIIKATSPRADLKHKIQEARPATVKGLHKKNGKRCAFIDFGDGTTSTIVPDNLEVMMEVFEPPSNAIRMYADAELVNTPNMKGIIVNIDDAANDRFTVAWKGGTKTSIVDRAELTVSQAESFPAISP